MKTLTEEQIYNISEKLTLEILKCASDKTNYQILSNLPTTVKNVMEITGLSKMPTYRRIKQLKKTGLLNHKDWEGILEPTELTAKVLENIDLGKDCVKKNLAELVRA